MIQPILTDLATALKAALPDLLHEVYDQVRVGRKPNTDGELMVFPVAITENGKKEFPMNDQRGNTAYLRVTGPPSTASVVQYRSCKRTPDDLYPVRLVFRYIQNELDPLDFTLLRSIRHALDDADLTPQDDYIKDIKIRVVGENPDRFIVWEEEFLNVPKRWQQNEILLAIDFDLTVRYSMGGCRDEVTDLGCEVVPAITINGM